MKKLIEFLATFSDRTGTPITFRILDVEVLPRECTGGRLVEVLVEDQAIRIDGVEHAVSETACNVLLALSDAFQSFRHLPGVTNVTQQLKTFREQPLRDLVEIQTDGQAKQMRLAQKVRVCRKREPE